MPSYNPLQQESFPEPGEKIPVDWDEQATRDLIAKDKK